MAVDRSTFLPVSRADLESRGLSEVDCVFVTGDAYVDHPSFGAALIGRFLESHGYTVAILSQPDWQSVVPFRQFGRPRLAFLISAGNLDSMVNHYTSAKKPRSDDAYAPGGMAGRRPDRATIVYSSRCREAFRGVPLIIGGIEASLRRFAHYDYWHDRVRRSILADSKADLLLYGMAEETLLATLRALEAGRSVAELGEIPGAVRLLSADEAKLPENGYQPGAVDARRFQLLPSFEEVAADKRAYAVAFRQIEYEQNPFHGRTLVQPHGDRLLFQSPPPSPLREEQMDAIYNLSFTRAAHPDYERFGGVPALSEVEFSLVSHRGCFGGCSFCALTYHQGRIIQRRSHDSLLDEAEKMIESPRFHGYIHDVGGPTANFRQPSCSKQFEEGTCQSRQCLSPSPCRKLEVDHSDYLSLLRKLRDLKGVKKVFIRSGIRFDYLMLDDDETFLEELVEHHISGQLKVAPEHVADRALKAMGKPPAQVYERFRKRYLELNEKHGKKQFLVPYLMSSHPGCTLDDAHQLAETIRQWGVVPQQVQEFLPTPGSLSSCMYYTGLDPRTLEPIYVARSAGERRAQRELLQPRKQSSSKKSPPAPPTPSLPKIANRQAKRSGKPARRKGGRERD